MKIQVTSGTGEEETGINAFDKALMDAGIADFNLVRLSSIIPEGSVVEAREPVLEGAEYGDRLYVVMSRNVVDEEGEEAWAGIGWAQERKSDKGVFMEGCGSSREEVKEYIGKALESACEYRQEDLKIGGIEVCGLECRGKPVCAVVAAVYEAEGWNE